MIVVISMARALPSLAAAPSSSLLDSAGLAELGVTALACCRRLLRDAGLDLACHCLESLLNIVGILCACLQKLHLQRIGELLGLVIRHDLLRREITLVSNHQSVHIVGCILVDFLHPMLDIVEGLLVCHVINDDDAVGATVVTARDSPEPLLPGSVPNLQLACLPFKIQGADLEIHTNRADVALSVR